MTYATSMRVKPIERQTIKSGGITKHNARKGKLAENVDPTRIEDNRVLVGTDDPARDLAIEIEGVQMSRKGENPSLEFVGAEIVLTAHHEFFEELSEQDFERWVTKNIEYLQTKFDGVGERGKLVNAILHMDEKAPHIHAIIAPVIEKSRIHPTTKEKMEAKRQINYTHIFLDRKAILGKARAEGRSHLDTKLGRMQTEYAGAMAEFGLVRGVESVRSKDKEVKHVTPKEYRIAVEGLEKQIAEKRAEYIAISKQVTQVEKSLESKKSEAIALARQVEERQEGEKKIIAAISSKKAELQGLEKKVTEKMSLVEQYEKKAESIKEISHSEFCSVQKKIDDLKKESVNLETSYYKNKEALEGWKSVVVDAEKKAASLQNEVAILEKQVSEKSSVVSSIEKSVVEKKSELQKVEKMTSEMVAQYEKAKTVAEKWTQHIEKLKDIAAERTPIPVWSMLCKIAGSPSAAADFVKSMPEDVGRAVSRTAESETQGKLLNMIKEAHAPVKTHSRGMSMGR